jgi:hypothetical protein
MRGLTPGRFWPIRTARVLAGSGSAATARKRQPRPAGRKRHRSGYDQVADHFDRKERPRGRRRCAPDRQRLTIRVRPFGYRGCDRSTRLSNRTLRHRVGDDRVASGTVELRPSTSASAGRDRQHRRSPWRPSSAANGVAHPFKVSTRSTATGERVDRTPVGWSRPDGLRGFHRLTDAGAHLVGVHHGSERDLRIQTHKERLRRRRYRT